MTMPVSGSKYTPLAELGRGGMATAYLAAVQGPGGFNKLVVVKRLRPSLAAEADFLKMFLEEARLSARIDHPNVVHTNEVGFDGEHYYIAMEYLDGQSLEAVVRRLAKKRQAKDEKSPLGGEADMPLKLHLAVISQMLLGLDFAHDLKDFDGNPLNVVHRDVSPHNVMITYAGQVKVLDFGIAKAADSSGDTRTGMMKGKCAYMPAEQFGGKNIDRRADVFAVGVMLWQALAGRKLWKGLSDAEIFQRVAKGEIPSPKTIREDVAPELEAICMKALARRPEDRFATAADFQLAIDDYVAKHPDLRTTAKELGTYVADLFADSRAKLKSIIEAQLGGGRSTQRNLALPVMTTAPGSTTDVIQVANTTPSASIGAPPARSRRIIALLGVALAAIGVVAIVLVRSGKSTQVDAAGANATNVLEEQTCALTITASPADAKIYFDDAPLDGNPATLKIRRDTIKHRLRTEAAGYVPKTELIALESAKMRIEVTLERVPEKTPTTAEKKPADKPHRPRTVVVWRPAPKPHPKASAKPETTATAAPASTPTTRPTAAPATTKTSKPGVDELDKGDPWATKKK